MDSQKKLRKRTNGLVFAIGAVTFLVMAFMAGWYGSLFVKDAAIREMVRSGMLVFMVSFFFSGVNAITSFYFTSIGNALASAVISCRRGLCFWCTRAGEKLFPCLVLRSDR